MKINFGKIGFLVSLLFLILAVSCISTQTLVIEIPQKPKNELPAYIQSLLLVNRTVNDKYTDIKEDSLQRLFYKQGFNYDTVIYDLQCADTTLHVLADLLFESGRYDVVIPENRFLEYETNVFLTREMPWQEVQQLCDTYNTDAVLSVDLLKTRISTDYKKESFFDPYRNGYNTGVWAEMKIYYEALIRVYDPKNEKIVAREFFKDTLFYEDADLHTTDLFRRFTPVKQAITEAGISVALDFSDKISTVWREESRKLLVGGDDQMKQALLLANNGEWEAAMKSWENVSANSNSKTNKSKAQYNLAVAYEILGDIDSAIYWGLQSYETKYNIVTYEYLEILKRRQSELLNPKK